MASSAGLNSLSHSVTFGVNLAVFTNLIQFMYRETKLKWMDKPHFRRWGPFYLIVFATVAVIADSVRHLINDANNWFLLDQSDGSKFKFHFGDCEYVIPSISGTDACPELGVGPVTVGEENALGMDVSMYNPDGSLSFYGWMFTIVGTWTGFAALFVGIFWFTGLGSKLVTQFRTLRTGVVQNDEMQEAFLSPTEEGFLSPMSESSPTRR